VEDKLLETLVEKDAEESRASLDFSAENEEMAVLTESLIDAVEERSACPPREEADCESLSEAELEAVSNAAEAELAALAWSE
jgi:hypothetical protein